MVKIFTFWNWAIIVVRFFFFCFPILDCIFNYLLNSAVCQPRAIFGNISLKT